MEYFEVSYPSLIAVSSRTLFASTPSLELIPPIAILALEVALPAVPHTLASIDLTRLAAASVGVTAILKNELVLGVTYVCSHECLSRRNQSGDITRS